MPSGTLWIIASVVFGVPILWALTAVAVVLERFVVNPLWPLLPPWKGVRVIAEIGFLFYLLIKAVEFFGEGTRRKRQRE